MSKHFATALIAAAAWLVGCCPGAFAHSSSRHADQSTGHPDPFAWVGESGNASFYGRDFQGRRSANGNRFDQGALTAAHSWLPFGTRVRVIRADTGRSVVVTITDRVYAGHRVVDLSLAAARALGMVRRGVAEVRLAPV